MTDSDVTFSLVVGFCGSVLAIMAILAIDLLKPQRFCPDCHGTLPKLRRLKNRRQRREGGWTCPQCACEVSRKGLKVLA
jgi:hypothetical protein